MNQNDLDIVVLEERVEKSELSRFVKRFFGNMVKVVVDVRSRIAAVGGDLHADAEQKLLERGSRKEDLWGANYHPGEGRDRCIEYSALINIRPSKGNPSMEIVDDGIQRIVREVIHELIGEGEELR